MSCKFDKEIIQKYIDNTIEPLEFVFLQEHLKYCTDCRRELDTLEAADKELFSFFGEEMKVIELDKLVGLVVDECMDEITGKFSLKYTLVKGVEVSKDIVHNTRKIVGYLPGTKLVKKGIRYGAASIGNGVKALIKKEVRKVFVG